MFRSLGRSFSRANTRLYSTESKDSLFLSDLLNRIDKISAKSTSILNEKRLKKPTQRTSSPTEKTDVKVKVADHPLASNSFKDNAKKFNRSSDNKKFREDRPARGPRENKPQRDARAKTPRENSTTEKPIVANRNARPPRRDSKPRFNQKKSTIADAPVIPSKKLTVETYTPKVNGSTFFYGKPTTVNPGLTSRVASVAKEALIESKYPYHLPKSVINSLDETPRNKFLLQKSFTLDINEEKFGKRINEVVKGKWEELQFNPTDFKDEESLKLASTLKNELMKNGDLSISNKNTIFEAALGLKTPKQLVQGTHWDKN